MSEREKTREVETTSSNYEVLLDFIGENPSREIWANKFKCELTKVPKKGMAWDYINVHITNFGYSKEYTYLLSPAGLEKREATVIVNVPGGKMQFTGKDSYEEWGPMGRNDYDGASEYTLKAFKIVNFVQKLIEQEKELGKERLKERSFEPAEAPEPYEGLGSGMHELQDY